MVVSARAAAAKPPAASAASRDAGSIMPQLSSTTRVCRGEERGVSHQGNVLEAGRRAGGASLGRPGGRGLARRLGGYAGLRVAPVEEAVVQLALDEDQVEELVHVVGAQVAVGEARAVRGLQVDEHLALAVAHAAHFDDGHRQGVLGQERPGLIHDAQGAVGAAARAGPHEEHAAFAAAAHLRQPVGAQSRGRSSSAWQIGPSVRQEIRSGQGCPGEWVQRAQQGCRRRLCRHAALPSSALPLPPAWPRLAVVVERIQQGVQLLHGQVAVELAVQLDDRGDGAGAQAGDLQSR